ncbi:glutamate--cysteine ligase [Caballeronia arationis]|jgi:glutamate--cysteine ligase|uniref:Glutamate--cysteine ligase n=1 Tax=Caballeronia arationis TaxID=1777142 RepID=A0A7Z7IBU7_9BURK|nr:glutamate--cysteine ligase [Caballeronia arationis]SAK43145.1 glutamate--cysteine ligase [Caballeronia arationis]SOE83087.1 glutamate-cysteine ligase [Caballeronia arationis]
MPNKNSVHPATDAFRHRLSALAAGSCADALRHGLRGIERESLRVTREGKLAMTPHPRAFGSALTHPQITTDYSEALVELITDAKADSAAALEHLDTLHRFVYGKLGDELLWNDSMPCELPPDDEIPIGWYGTSNIGMLKYVYRRGLSLRYGRTMQCIAGIHYNYSLSEDVWRAWQSLEKGNTLSAVDFQSERYFALIRNFRRTSWLLMYLFGASPALEAGFVRGKPHTLDTFDADTFYLPHATSLRMSDLGYTNNPAQSALLPSYDNLDAYLDVLGRAVSQPYPPYEAIGTQRDGEWVQINTNVLQIENEFYSTIRPKRVIQPGERPLHALSARGVQYIEVRCLDIDPFEPSGISLETSRFLDAYLLYCALDDSPLLPREANAEANDNFSRVAKEGRKPGLDLSRDGRAVPMQAWGTELLDRIAPVAETLDALNGTDEYMRALATQRARLADVALTPSARVLQIMRDKQQSFGAFALDLSEQHAAFFRSRPLPEAITRELDELAAKSLEQQAAIERDEAGSFDAFIAAYRAYTLNRVSV